MKCVYPTLSFFLLSCVFAAEKDSSTFTADVNDDRLLKQFQDWMKKYDRSYSSDDEFQKRFGVWKTTNAYIIKRNKEVSSFKLGHNIYSDLTLDEFHQRFNLGEYYVSGIKEKIFGNEKNFDKATTRRVLDELPDYVNWVEEGAVVGVKDQGSCGSCWAFSAVGAVETVKYLQDNELVSLSEQEMMDCDEHLINNSCNGGNMGAAFGYVTKNEGLCSEEDYPYIADFQDCADDTCENVVNTNISGYTPVKYKSTEDLMSSLAEQTVSIGLDAGSDDFKSYESGVFTGECGTNLNHGLLGVGYGTDDASGLDYWYLKNSWGEDWGDSGYMKLYREGGEGVKGTCGCLLDNDKPDFPEN